MKTSTRFVCPFLIVIFFADCLYGQNYFTAVGTAAMSRSAHEQATKKVSKMGVYSLDEVALRKHLSNAPLEFKNNGKPVPVQVPLPDGTLETFNLVESPVLSPEVAAQNPDVKTYAGNGTTDKMRIIRLSLTSSGFNAIILNVNGDAVYFEPYSKGQPNVYFNYFTKDAVGPANFKCGSQPINNGRPLPAVFSPRPFAGDGTITNGTTSPNTTGSSLKTYRLAFAADGEFVANHGGTAVGGFNAVVAYVNRIKAVYRNELSADFILVSGTNLIYTNATTDPYTNDNLTNMLTQNINVCKSLGRNAFDIGHVLGYSGPGGSGGGIAYSPSLGIASTMAGGVSEEADPSAYAQVFSDKLVEHEMGHQFSMNHSYNSNTMYCDTRNQPTSMEPGSGATIMSYGFTCDNDDDYYDSSNTSGQRIGPLLNFHNVSYREAVNYMYNTIPDIGTTTVTGNVAPFIVMPFNFTVPLSTPFSLIASATDADNDALSYSWEGADPGTVTDPTAATLANTALPPFSRSYTPVGSATRTFPLLSGILSGANYAKADKLPSVAIAATYTFTVRDNNASGGGVAYGTDTVTVDGNQSPFLITNDLTGAVGESSTQTITWNVNAVTALANPLVKISLSTDGGLTFPFVLLSAAANTGTAPVMIPLNSATTKARIKVEAVGNIFFDISNSDFAISSALPVTLTGFTATLQNKKDALLNWETATETNSKGFEIQMATGSAAVFTDVAFLAGKGTAGIASNYSIVVPNLTPGTYYFRLKLMDIDGSFTYSSVRSITFLGDRALISIYPMPVRDQLTVVLSVEMQNAQLQLFNSLGQVLLVDITASGNTRLLNMGNLPAGLYLLKVMDGPNTVTTHKVIKK